METALKVAFATSDRKHVDQHFGAARGFAIYAVDAHCACLCEVNEFVAESMDGNEDKLAGKIDALRDCVAVYSQAVGASAIAQLKAQGIQPVKVAAGVAIADLVESLQAQLRAGPAGWLARALAAAQPSDPARFDRMEAEGWEE
jgi:nitrogen fixation protein NifX